MASYQDTCHSNRHRELELIQLVQWAGLLERASLCKLPAPS